MAKKPKAYTNIILSLDTHARIGQLAALVSTQTGLDKVSKAAAVRLAVDEAITKRQPASAPKPKKPKRKPSAG